MTENNTKNRIAYIAAYLTKEIQAELTAKTVKGAIGELEDVISEKAGQYGVKFETTTHKNEEKLDEIETFLTARAKEVVGAYVPFRDFLAAEQLEEQRKAQPAAVFPGVTLEQLNAALRRLEKLEAFARKNGYVD